MTAGNRQTITNQSFAQSAMRVPPAATGAVLWCYFGASLAASQNLVGAALTNIGTGPVYPPANNYASFTHATAALQTAIADVAGSFTVLAVARTQLSTGLACPISNYNNTPGNNGVRMRIGSGAGYDAFIPGSGTSIPQTLFKDGCCTAWKFLAIAHQAGVGATMYCKTDNTLLTSAGTANRTISTANWQIGQTPAGTDNSVEVDVAFAGVLQSYLDATGIDLTYQAVQQTLGLRGIRT